MISITLTKSALGGTEEKGIN